MNGKTFRETVKKNEALIRELYRRGYCSETLFLDVDLADKYKTGKYSYRDLAALADANISRIYKRIQRCM